MSLDPRKKLSAAEAAKHLGMKPYFLQHLRSTGGGPPYFKIGSRCIYQLGDLEAWLATKRTTETVKKKLKKEPRAAPDRLPDAARRPRLTTAPTAGRSPRLADGHRPGR